MVVVVVVVVVEVVEEVEEVLVEVVVELVEVLVEVDEVVEVEVEGVLSIFAFISLKFLKIMLGRDCFNSWRASSISMNVLHRVELISPPDGTT